MENNMSDITEETRILKPLKQLKKKGTVLLLVTGEVSLSQLVHLAQHGVIPTRTN